MPKEILTKQAAYLSELTRNVLIAEIETNPGVRGPSKDKVIIHSFVVRAPAMGNYQFTLLRVVHDFGIYPLQVHDDLLDDFYILDTEEEFVDTLSTIFSSVKTQNAIRALIAQSA